MTIISEFINSFDPSKPNFRPTEIYNESWLVKLVLHQASTIPQDNFPISFLKSSTWFSEALLPTVFKARSRGDQLSESRTNADGVIGQIKIGEQAKADLDLSFNATQLTVVEAKISAPLSPGVSHAKYFDQAARNVACMAEILSTANRKPTTMIRLDFVVLAPQGSIDKGTYSAELSKDSIKNKVRKRVTAYEGTLDNWYEEKFLPLLNEVQLHALSWEKTLAWITNHNPRIKDDLVDFYELCLRFN